MAKNIINQPFGTEIIQIGRATQTFYTLLDALVNLEIIFGDGNPEGVESANFRTLYVDTSGSDTDFLYIKKVDEETGDPTLGWRKIPTVLP